MSGATDICEDEGDRRRQSAGEDAGVDAGRQEKATQGRADAGSVVGIGAYEMQRRDQHEQGRGGEFALVFSSTFTRATRWEANGNGQKLDWSEERRMRMCGRG